MAVDDTRRQNISYSIDQKFTAHTGLNTRNIDCDAKLPQRIMKAFTLYYQTIDEIYMHLWQTSAMAV